MEIRIPNPHDKFFKESFSRLEVAKSFIEEVFPKDMRDKMNLNTLQLWAGITIWAKSKLSLVTH